MAAGIRPDMKIAKIVYSILNTPKDQQQGKGKPTKKMIEQWRKDSNNGAR